MAKQNVEMDSSRKMISC